ncbi:monocarboxylate transporter [Ilyonectria sp. MPI-CAGE-AT-0026]|nr:monocarboxylate transporter [Ilyonectria sp. MPI-CAGE-AT-0026]
MASLTKGLPRGQACEEAESAESEQQQSKHSRWRYTLILIAAFMINFTACGLLFGFGIYQALYETMVLEDGTPFTGASSAEIDLIGTLSISLMTIGAPFAVAWVKIFSPQAIVCAGGLLFGLACVLASFGKALWHFQLSQGLLLGIGTCLSFMPSMTVAPSWFGKHRGLAMGLISAGTGIGGLVWAPIAKQRKFIAQALGAAFQSAAYYTPVFFIASYAKTLGYNDTDGANFTAVSNACNAIGKIAIGFVADRFGRLNAFFFTTLTSAFVTGLWVSSTIVGMDNEATARSLFVSFTVLYGIFASAYISLFPPALVELFGAQELPRVIGFMYMMQGAAAMVGTPVAGVLVRGHGTVKDPDSYSSMAILVGALLLVATGAVAWVRLEVMCDRAGGKWQWKWKM